LSSSFFPILFLISCLSNFAFANPINNAQGAPASEKSLRVCSTAGYIPFEMRDSAGNWDGYEIKILEKFAHQNHYKLILKHIEYDGLIPSLVARKSCDLIASTLAVNLERGNMIEFSKPILITHFSAIIRLSDKDKFTNFDKINTPTTRMAVQTGTEDDSYVKKFAKNVEVLGYSNNIDPVLSILTNRADVYIEDINYLKLMKKKYYTKLDLLDPKLIPNNPDVAIAFALRKSDTKFIGEINNFLETIEKNGELAQLKKDYFEDDIWKPIFEPVPLRQPGL
jgi:polar amino acid transport system substrate-binding protein